MCEDTGPTGIAAGLILVFFVILMLLAGLAQKADKDESSLRKSTSSQIVEQEHLPSRTNAEKR